MKRLIPTITLVVLTSTAVANDYGYQNNDSEYKYESNLGTEYKYDLSKPTDRLMYDVDPTAKLMDSINPMVDLDRNMGQYGGGSNF